MSRIETSSAEQTWSAQFTFAGMRASEWGFKEKLWKESALKVAALLQDDTNVGVRLGTGGGKTIIAILAATAFGARTLFLTPTRYLAVQHNELLRNTLGYAHPSRVITGDTRACARIWKDLDERFVFATGAVFASALKKGEVALETFALVIFDEFHRARGNYDYVTITPEFERRGVRRLALSASPGSSREEVELTLINTAVERLVGASIPEQPKHDEYHFIELTSEMERADRDGWKLLEARILADLRLVGLVIPPNWRHPAREFARLHEKIGALPTTRRTKMLRVQFAKYRLYLYAYHAFMTCSYAAFLGFVQRLRERRRPSDRRLLGEPLFRRLVATARHYYDAHPKVVKLERILRLLESGNRKAIVFFADKTTAEYCKKYLDERSVRAETAFGSSGKKPAELQAAIDALREGRVTALLATSVLHEGVSIPEVDLVINFSVAPSAITRLQSSGRTGRMRPGKVVHFILDHSLDRLVFFPVHNEMKTMNMLFTEIDEEGLWKGQQSLFLR